MRSWLLVALALVLTGCGPLVMIPGGELSGEVVSSPADWAFTDAIDTVQLETRPEDPYSVNVWAVSARGALYIAAGGGAESEWARHIAADPRVRLRADGRLYELRAERTDSDEERSAFLEAAQAKYDFEPSEDETDGAVLFRLTPPLTRGQCGALRRNQGGNPPVSRRALVRSCEPARRGRARRTWHDELA